MARGPRRFWGAGSRPISDLWNIAYCNYERQQNRVIQLQSRFPPLTIRPPGGKGQASLTPSRENFVMRRLAVTLAVSAVALSACTQTVGEAIGELTRGPVAAPAPVPTPAPAPQRQAAATPAPAATPVPVPRGPAAPPPRTATAEPESKGGLRLPRIPGLPRRDASAPAPAAPTPPPSGGGGFLGLGVLFGPAPNPSEYVTPNDKTPYRQVTMDGLSKGVRDNSLPVNLPVEVTANVDARFTRQIVIDLRGGGALAVSRREGDCIQVLLPYSLAQDKFGTGRYLVKGIYRRQWMPNEGFIYEQNHYEPACGDAYFFVRSIVKAP